MLRTYLRSVVARGRATLRTRPKTKRALLAGCSVVAGGALVTLVVTTARIRTVYSQTDQRQSAFESAIQRFTPEQAAMLRPLLKLGVPTAAGGEIHGFVAAAIWDRLSLRETALSGAKVFIQTDSGGVDQQSLVKSDSWGRFRIPWRVPGFYNVCASLDGFVKACSVASLENQNLTILRPIALKPTESAIRGCVTLKDGTPAVRAASALHESAAYAEVSLESAPGHIVAGPVPVNAAGCYVLPAAKSIATADVVVNYEQARRRQALSQTALDPSNRAPVNLVLPTSPPTIASFTAAMNGKQVFQAQPGSTVAVEIKATSPNNYPLHYSWADGSGALLPGDQPTKEWKLPRTNSMNLIFVEVSDGHGGVARASLPVPTGPVSATEEGRLRGSGSRLHTRDIPGLGPSENLTYIDPSLFMGGCSDSGTGSGSCAAEAGNYYQTIGVFDSSGSATGSYSSFGTWKKAWGFSDDPTNPGPSETRAVYYNNNDLQFGRDMHCITNTAGGGQLLAPGGGGIYRYVIRNYVCYVANYSDTSNPINNDPQTSIEDAEGNTNPIAAVAMLSTTIQNVFDLGQAVYPFVQFIVFTPPKGSGAGTAIDDFVPNTEAVLDGQGAKAVPGVCIACHGGTYSTSTHNLTGTLMARFLPFDTPSFLYDTRLFLGGGFAGGRPFPLAPNPFRESAQAENFRALNIIAENASKDRPAGLDFHQNSATVTSQTVIDLINGWYSWCGGVNTPGCYIDDNSPNTFIPSGSCASATSPATCGWNATALTAQFYQQVPRTVCRTCHVAHSDIFNWENYTSASSGAACYPVQNYDMPFAEVPYNRFWSSSADQTAFTNFPSMNSCSPLTPP